MNKLLNHDRGFWAIAFTLMVVMAYSAFPTPLYGLYAARDGFGALTITAVFAAYAVGVAISLFLVGHLSDTYGRRRVLLPSLALTAVSAVLFLLWRDLPGLLVARVINGLAVGAVTATATAWIAELHAGARPDADARRAEIVGVAANIGGIGSGALIAGLLAQWVTSPLTVPYVVGLVGLLAAIALVAVTPETRAARVPRPAYRPQRVSVPPPRAGSTSAPRSARASASPRSACSRRWPRRSLPPRCTTRPRRWPERPPSSSSPPPPSCRSRWRAARAASSSSTARWSRSPGSR